MARQSLLSVLLDLNADGFENGLQKAQRSMRRTGRSMQRSGQRLTRSVTAPLGLIAASSFKVAADFEASMAKVKAVSGATSSEFKALENNARELGSTTRFTASEVSALQLEFSKLGFSASEITKVTRNTLNLAQATGSDLATSAEVAGSTLRAFGLDASQMGRVTDVMASSFSSSALDLESFKDSMKFVAPVAAAAGVSLEEATAMLAQLANNGIKGSTAGTALRRILSTVGATGGDVKEELAKLSEEVITLGDAKDSVGRTAQSAFLILKKGLGTVDELTDTFNDATGSSQAMADIMDDTAEGALKRMQSAVEGAQITIGKALAPTVLDIIKRIEGLATSFSNLSKGTQGFIVKAGLAAAAIGPFKSSLGSLLVTISKSQRATKLLSKSLTLLGNPYTALAAAAGVLVYNLLEQAGAFEEVNAVHKRVQAVSDRAADSYVEEGAKVQALAEEYRLFQDDMDKRKQVLEDLKAINPGYFGDLDAEKTKYEDLMGAVSDYMEEVKQAAIQKAFGDELVEIVAEELKAKEELREAELRLAKAREWSTKANEAQGGSIKDGTSTRLEASEELAAATRAQEKAEKNLNDLGDARVEVLGKIQRAEESLAAVRTKAGLDPVTGGKETQVKATVVVEPPTQEEIQTLERKMPKVKVRGELKLKVDTRNPGQVMRELSRAMGVAKLQADAFGDSFDLVGAQVSATEDAINNLLLQGFAPYSTEVQELVMQLEKLKAKQAETTDGMAGITDKLGGVFEQLFTTMAEGSESTAEAAKRAGAEIAKIFLAQAMAGVIKESFSKAPPPIAAAMAAAGVAAVNGLFNSLVKLREGGLTMGPQLALIGDNPSGKEAVIPFEKMGRFIEMATGGSGGGTQDVRVHGRLQGGDVLIATSRDKRTTRRAYGAATFA